jgi:hypothetical protein
MGAGKSTSNTEIDAFTKQTSNIMMESINKFGSTSSTNVSQDINMGMIRASGSSKIKNITVEMKSDVNLSLLANQEINAALQNDMKDKFSQNLENAHTQFPSMQIGTSDTNVKTKMTNIFETNVSQKFGTENLSNLSASISQKMKLAGIEASDDGEIDGVMIRQVSDLISGITNDIASKVAAASKKESEVDNSVSNKSVDPVSATVGAVGSALSNVLGTTLSGLNQIMSVSPFALIIIAIVLITGGYFGYKTYFADPDGKNSFMASIGSLF